HYMSKDALLELKKLLKGKTIVAHNASFDMKFLLYNFYIYDVDYYKFRVIDTLKFSRKYIHETENHKLKTLKDYFKLDDGNSHNALSDCRATANLALLLYDRENSSK
ncbi:PolC-type DNA polymerase III, partial [Staphylococcus auricularis]